MTNNLQQRFRLFWGEAPEGSLKEAKERDILAFIKAELMLLAQEAIQKQIPVIKGQVSIEDYEYANGVNNGIAVITTLIRDRAGEIGG